MDMATFFALTRTKSARSRSIGDSPTGPKRFRLEEGWFIDRRTSTLQVRMLAINPLRDKTDDDVNFLYALPMFRVYFPDARAFLARAPAFVAGNDNAGYS